MTANQLRFKNVRFCLGSGVLLALALGPQVSLAQAVDTSSGGASSKQVSQPGGPANIQALDPPKVERLFGNWDGPSTKLWQDGVNLQFDALTEFAGNVGGGTKQGATFASQIGASLDINWERLAGLTGLSTHVIMVNRSGSSDSSLFGDNISPVQEIYGSGGDVAVHLVSAYAEETLLDKRFDLEVGRMNVENDFASSPLYCNFMNNGLCGDPKALPGGDRGHSAYPDGIWGSRLKLQPVPELSVEAGVYEVDQGLYSYANFRSGFKFDTSQDSGVYLPFEIAWEPKFGPSQLPGHYKVGIGYDTSGGYENYENALALAGVPGYAATSHRGALQTWALFDQMLVRQGPGANDGITAIAGVASNNPSNTVYAQQYYGGFIDQDFWAARPKDSFGILMMYYAISGRLGHVQDIEQSLGLPLSNAATGVQRYEIILEAEYDIHVFRGVSFRPDFQYVVHPNAQMNIGNATVLGFQAHVEF